MTRYIVLYHAPRHVAERFATATPEQAQAGLGAWLEWSRELGPALVDLGKPLGRALRVTSADVSEADADIIGMSIIQAETMEAALGFVQDHHHLGWDEGCSITLLEETAIPELAGRTD